MSAVPAYSASTLFDFTNPEFQTFPAPFITEDESVPTIIS